jgi:alpha-tubulin suppressor-like RCC1 family protein
MSLTFTAAVRANKPKRNVGKIDDTGLQGVALDRKGTAFGWGYNNNGNLGDNTTISRLTPVSVSGAKKTFCEISGGGQHVLGIDKNGRLWGWGYNTLGTLGDNSFTNRCTPVSVAGAVKTFCTISGGYRHSTAIDKNGRAWGWGYNRYGQIGNNAGGIGVCVITPVSVVGAVKTFCKISAGVNSTIAIDKNGRAWGWGYNYAGQLGDNSTISRLTPVSVLGTVKTFCQISAGGNFCIAIDKNGRAWGWGINSNGQLGDNSAVSRLTPVSVAGTVKTFCKIAAGELSGNFSVGIDKNGKAWVWGSNSEGFLGNNTHDLAVSVLTPVAVYGNKTFCQISAGSAIAYAIDKNNRLWAWGRRIRLGNNDFGYKCTPVAVVGAPKTFCAIGANANNSGGIDKNGRLWMWGRDEVRQLGDNSLLSQQHTPVSILGAVKTFCKISVGGGSNSGIDKNGQVWCWGANSSGQLGDNTTSSRATPVSIVGSTKTFCKISVGIGVIIRLSVQTTTVAIDKNGRAWGWGRNSAGQVGNNSITNPLTPVSIVGTTKTFCEISTSGFHSVAIDKNGRAWGWGYNGQGQLGDNSITSRLTPVSVLGATKTFCKIANAANHTMAIDKNGRAWGWGINTYGQLGDNSITSRLTPVSVAGVIKTFCEISCGTNSSVAIDKNGRAWGWGLNNGILGVGDMVSSYITPVSVAGVVKTFCKISIGGSVAGSPGHVTAIDKNGKVWAWGTNFYGQLGNDQGGIAKTPVQVCNI